jgi:hypothetical protein
VYRRIWILTHGRETHLAEQPTLRTGDPATGGFQDAVVLAQFREVDLDSVNE